MESFNRTILELKQICIFSTFKPWNLLIEPFWNWNFVVLCSIDNSLAAFNRTILELKRNCNKNKGNYKQTFNRTILELKPISSITSYNLTSRLLIEPFWNWNFDWAFTYTFILALLIEPFWNWNDTPLRLLKMVLTIF